MAWDVDKAVRYLDQHAHGHSLGRCAEATREAIEAGGVVLIRHRSARDYGPSLVQAGFHEFAPFQLSSFQAGDVAVIQSIPGHPHGHMAMFDGAHWVSDFTQKTLYPGAAYRKYRPAFKIYRYGLSTSGDDSTFGSSTVPNTAVLI